MKQIQHIQRRDFVEFPLKAHSPEIGPCYKTAKHFINWLILLEYCQPYFYQKFIHIINIIHFTDYKITSDDIYQSSFKYY